MVRKLKGGSIASQQLAAQMPGKCSCNAVDAPVFPLIPGEVTNFYMTTGGGRHKKKASRKASRKATRKVSRKATRKVSRKATRKVSRKASRQRGGSVLSDTVMQGVLAKCNGVTEIPSFPNQSGGGSDWLGTHNSRSAQPMSPEQFGKFTNGETLLPGGQMSKCILNGPMW